jgi:hypothetical protein
MKILSLGWGIQSYTLAAMSACGDIEKVDCAIHADTLHESALTYEFARKWKAWLIDKGVKVITVINPTGDLMKSIQIGQTYMPVFTIGKNGKKGQALRSCTDRWKIVPMHRWLQENRKGQSVEMWIGISTDEALRMKPSGVKYITNRWPLIEKGMSREDCRGYLEDHKLEVPPKSACTFCPYHNSYEWRRIQHNALDWQEATTIDKAIRNIRPPLRLFVHPARKPLETIDLRTEQEKGQMNLWDEECSGICGV